MTVLLSDTEAEQIASILRRMNERVDAAADTTVAHVDDRGPSDFAGQLEALIDAGNPTLYVPTPESTPLTHAFMTSNAAHTFATKTGHTAVDDVDIIDPSEGVPDE